MVCHYSLYCEKHGLQIRAIGSKYRNEKAMISLSLLTFYYKARIANPRYRE